MKILAVTYSGELSGGANRSLLMVLKNLKEKYGHEITLISPVKGNMMAELDKVGIPWFLANYSSLNAPKPYNLIDVLRYVNMFVKSAKYNREAAKVADKVRNDKYDIVYTTEIFSYFGLYLSQHLSLPHVWHFRSASENYLYMPLSKRMFETMDGKIIVISNYLREYMNQTHSIPYTQMETISNGLDLKDVPLSSQSRENGYHLLLCSRMVKAKGHIDALTALNELIKRGHKDIYLHFAGSVPNYAVDGYIYKINDYIKENALESHVIFEGEVDDMVTLREHMNVELMCSIAEAFGRVTIEGMYSGLVVIGSNTGGTLDIIQDGENGLLYEQGNGIDLADKIENVFMDKVLANRLSTQAVEFIKTHFTMEQNVFQINAVLQDSLERHKEIIK